MTNFVLVRHGVHDRVGRFLDGRRDGVHLSATGERQAEAVAQSLHRRFGRVQAVLSSPLERARETAAPIAAAFGLPVAIEAGLNEIDFGDWSGRSFEELQPLEAWQRWNSARSTATTPAGDTMRASQARILDVIDACRRAPESAPESTFVLVSHADPLKAALAYALGLSLDGLARFTLDPASISRMVVDPWGARVDGLNETPL